MSDLFVDNIKHQSSQGSGTITLGASGEKITTASGAEFSAVTGHNYPAFFINRTSNQTSIAKASWVKIQYNNVVFDTDSGWDSTNLRWEVPTGKGGKYYLEAAAGLDCNTASTLQQWHYAIYKNGSRIYFNRQAFYNNNINIAYTHVSRVVDLSAGDYLEIYLNGDISVSNTFTYLADSGQQGFFQGYRLGA